MRGDLQRLLPGLEKVNLLFSRDQLFLLMTAVNQIFLGVDIYLAHMISGTIVPREWIPIIFGPIAGILILGAGLIARRRRETALVIANTVFVGSILVGLLGAYYHFIRAILPNAPPGLRISVNLLIWAPPVVGPLVFSLVGLLGISAVWKEEPVGSGRLLIWKNRHIQLPYSKTSAYYFMISLGTLATLLSSALDHARTDFENPWLWVPVITGLLGVLVPALLGFQEERRRGDILILVITMALLILTGLIGSWLHIQNNLTADLQFVPERFIRGAPFLAPLLYANMGMLGLLITLDPQE